MARTHQAAAVISVTVCVYLLIVCLPDVWSIDRRAKGVVKIIRAMGVLLWILFLFSIVRQEDRKSSCLMPALLWSACLWLSDSVTDGALLVIEPATLNGLFFGLSALVGSRPDAPHSRLFFYAVLVYMLFVLPTHDLQPDTQGFRVAQAVRRTAIVWAVGLLLTAGFLTRDCAKA